MSSARCEIKVGAYYRKRTSPHDEWLRLVVQLPSRANLWNVVYADFTGIGACSHETFLRWAERPWRSLARDEADSNEVAKIDALLADVRREKRITVVGVSWD